MRRFGFVTNLYLLSDVPILLAAQEIGSPAHAGKTRRRPDVDGGGAVSRSSCGRVRR